MNVPTWENNYNVKNSQLSRRYWKSTDDLLVFIVY